MAHVNARVFWTLDKCRVLQETVKKCQVLPKSVQTNLGRVRDGIVPSVRTSVH